MLKISPILNRIRKPIYTGHNTTCPLKPLQKDVFTRSGEISFSSLQTPSVPEIEGKPVVFETKILKGDKPINAYVTWERAMGGPLLTLWAENNPNPLGTLSYYTTTSDEEDITTGYDKDEPFLYVDTLTRGRGSQDYQWVGTSLLRAALEVSMHKGLEGRMALQACDLGFFLYEEIPIHKTEGRIPLYAHNFCTQGNKEHPALFYYKNGFRFSENGLNEKLEKNKDCKEDFDGDSFIMYLPKEGIKTLQAHNENDKFDPNALESAIDKASKKL